MYTDCSKNKDGCGSSFFIPKLKVCKVFKIHPLCSVFSSELWAILNCLRWVYMHCPPKVLIASDSLSSLNSIRSVPFCTTENSLPQEIFITTAALINQGIEIHYIWTPSHRGIEGNERADKLAKEGSNQRIPCNKTDITCKEGKQLAKQVCREKFITEFRSTDAAQHYKNSITCTTKVDINMPKWHTTTLFRLLSGHCRLNAHLKRIGLHDTGNCEACGIEETVEHFIMQCPKYAQARNTLFRKIRESGLQPPTSLRELWANDKIVQFCLDFIKKSQRVI